jgi:hypothetical protein
VKLISFGAGLPGIASALERVKRQAAAIELIDSVVTFDSRDLGEPYAAIFGSLPEEFPRGYGLWSWKPFVVNMELAKLLDGDILIYMDAGVEINPAGATQLREYLDFTSATGSLFFSVGLQQRHWTKFSDALVPREHFFRNQLASGLFMLKASPETRSLVKQWLELCAEDNAAFLKDPAPSEHMQIQGFIGHRHDQSVLSKIVFDHNIQTKPDRTYFEPWRKGRHEPFLAFRNKQTGFSWLWPAFWLPRNIFNDLWIPVSISLAAGTFWKQVFSKLFRWNPVHAKSVDRYQ